MRQSGLSRTRLRSGGASAGMSMSPPKRGARRRIAAGAAIAAVSLLLLAPIVIAQPVPSPPPIMPPSLPPSHVVNLMTQEGAALLGAQWRVTDIKIVEVPAAVNKDRYKTTYQIEPRAMGVRTSTIPNGRSSKI